MVNRVDKYRRSFVAVVALVLLCSCMLFGTTLAWLTRQYTKVEEHNSIGSVHLALMYNSVEITGNYTEVGGVTIWECNQPIEITGSNALRDTSGLKVRNTGTINALVRATISVYYEDSNNNHVNFLMTNTPSARGQARVDYTGWIGQFFSPTISCGYLFLDDTLKPYNLNSLSYGGTTTTPVVANQKSIINSITLSDAQKTDKILISVTLEAVAYDGNIYKKIEAHEETITDIPVRAFPFGLKETLPTSWNAWR